MPHRKLPDLCKHYWLSAMHASDHNQAHSLLYQANGTSPSAQSVLAGAICITCVIHLSQYIGACVCVIKMLSPYSITRSLVCNGAMLYVQVVHPPQCTFEGAEDLIQGCAAELQTVSAAAASKVDLPASLLLNGWLQRHCFMYAAIALVQLHFYSSTHVIPASGFHRSYIVGSTSGSCLLCARISLYMLPCMLECSI